MIRHLQARHRVPGAQLDGTPSSTVVTAFPRDYRIALRIDEACITPADAAKLALLLRDGRGGTVAVSVDTPQRGILMAVPNAAGFAAIGADATMLVFLPFAPIPRRCAGLDVRAILHDAGQTRDLVAGLCAASDLAAVKA
jgi:hypothetical protein